ncbi:MAG TPA: tRNA pseudouridine(55) synthase TruB [Candidatus Acidoferrum sp.]|nr:tRNA pseudouridine(55) synthase TruB [Candidatus Acidoferrum sp.]
MSSSAFNGVLLIDKPAGISSFGVVARVRRVLSEQAGKKIKVGHTGTLDPFASGLMIIVVGDWCKRAGEFSKLDKTYEATARLGQSSSTGDPEGELSDVSKRVPTRGELEAALQAFRGAITQKPPIYSAIKINGQRAYNLARRGEAVDIPARSVTIYQLELLEYAYPNFKIRAHVSSGTYIRTLVADIGQQMGVGAYCQALRRTSVGSLIIQDSLPLDSFMAKPILPNDV